MNNFWLILFVSINIIQKWNSYSVPCIYPHPQSFWSVSHLHKWHYHFPICSNQRLQSHTWLFAFSHIPHPIHLKFYQLYFQNTSWIKWFFTTSIISTLLQVIIIPFSDDFNTILSLCFHFCSTYHQLSIDQAEHINHIISSLLMVLQWCLITHRIKPTFKLWQTRQFMIWPLPLFTTCHYPILLFLEHLKPVLTSGFLHLLLFLPIILFTWGLCLAYSLTRASSKI